jgi:hypothetical protein
VSAAQKGYIFRRSGYNIPFKPTDDLVSFQNVVWEFLKGTGMDNTFYLRGPTGGTQMHNVTKPHTQYKV